MQSSFSDSLKAVVAGTGSMRSKVVLAAALSILPSLTLAAQWIHYPTLTIDDPKAYTKPWTVTIPWELFPDTELMEWICENEKDFQHLIGK